LVTELRETQAMLLVQVHLAQPAFSAVGQTADLEEISAHQLASCLSEKTVETVVGLERHL